MKLLPTSRYLSFDLIRRHWIFVAARHRKAKRIVLCHSCRFPYFRPRNSIWRRSPSQCVRKKLMTGKVLVGVVQYSSCQGNLQADVGDPHQKNISFAALSSMAMAATKLLLIDRVPGINRVEASDASTIPLIDLQGLFGPNRDDIIRQIGEACQQDGFFQIKNHGIPEEVVQAIMNIAGEFFRLPESERLKNYSDDPSKSTRLSTSFNIKTEKVSNWRDFLRLHCYPLEEYMHEWPTNPPSFRKEVGEYCTRVRELALKLLEAISESLGLEREYISKNLASMPELTYGLPGHTDQNLITILLQDDVPGLQVLRDGKWIAVDPIPNTFIVNIGDQMQVISNDKYKSILHRAVVNCDRERISIPTFYCPSPEALIGPAQGLIDHDNPAVYRSFTYEEYYHKFWNRGLRTECCLDMFKIPSS
ncbi:hypothetical protein EUGRSUZ_L00351 [Eucalyptus grandis]|uniref:Uncharacterized protein n=2 Tax=Eucalyptus grandis TaxID=71139 RepID=A0ACC3L5Z3_EUCGR|nr:hypothetical protein EUGRSUZ_L00351 [Eucalyptus grandis]